jgi:hypothetical protein
VQVGCRRILIDATWDSPLVKAGFLVNDPWDGCSEMKCAVKPLTFPVRSAFCHTLKNGPSRAKGEADLCLSDGEKNHWDVVDQARYYHEMVSVRTPGEVKRIPRFNRDFDAWLVDVRQQNSSSIPK